MSRSIDLFSFNLERESGMKKLIAAVFACCLPFAMGGAHAQDMKKDEMKKEMKKGGMKKEMKKGEMKKDAMGKGGMMKDMHKGGMMKDGKGGMMQEEMKK